MASAGVHVRLLGPMPTPAIAYLTRAFRAEAAIVISASHNSYQDNGIKFFSQDGKKLSDSKELEIEKLMEKSMYMVSANQLGNVKRYDDAPGRYVEFCKSTFGGFNANLKGLKIILDCANGATYHIAPRVFVELEANVESLSINPDGFNINENCGTNFVQNLQKTVLEKSADIGIAFDGDGDRVIMIDHKGEVVEGDELLFIIAKSLRDNNKLEGGVVGTLMSNLGLEKAIKDLNLDFVRTKVGDRYILEALQKTGWVLGGENSGHIINYGITTTGDGIVSALQVLSAMFETGKTLHELKKGMKKLPQMVSNISSLNKEKIMADSFVKVAIDDVKNELKDSGRVLVRPSGTEPLIRVMVEGKESKQVENLANYLATVVKEREKEL